MIKSPDLAPHMHCDGLCHCNSAWNWDNTEESQSSDAFHRPGCPNKTKDEEYDDEDISDWFT